MKKFPLILPSTEGLGVYNMILDVFSKYQLCPNIVAECSDISILLDLVASDFGASIVPETVIQRHKSYPIQAFKIADTNLSASTGLIWLKHHELSSIAQNFVNLYKSILKI